MGRVFVGPYSQRDDKNSQLADFLFLKIDLGRGWLSKRFSMEKLDSQLELRCGYEGRPLNMRVDKMAAAFQASSCPR